MNWVIPQSFGAISKRFREAPVENTLAAGITASFGVISYKGKVWAVRYRGATTHILAENGRDPAYSIEICLLKSSPAVSKTFYDTTYVEGSNEPPACMSTNGIVPDAGVPKKQAPACATCPNNAWGSRRTPDGKNAKACADNKRLAVVLMPNMLDEQFGGPMLLRVPPASLQDLANYGNQLAQHGYHEHSIVTRVAFNMKEAYPRFVFSAVRPLSDGEAEVAIDLRQSAEVSRILAEALEYVSPAEQRSSLFEQSPDVPTVAQRAVAVRAAAAPTPARTNVRKTITLTPAVPASATEPAQPAQPAQPSQPAQPAQPAPEPAEDPEEGIPTFLRRDKGKSAEEVEDDDAFLDEIDSKLAAMLPG